MIVVGRSMALENVIAFCNPSFLVTHSAARESFTKYVNNSHPSFNFFDLFAAFKMFVENDKHR